MFNGIIYNCGRVFSIKKNNLSMYIGIKSHLLLKKKNIGSSISCNGVCLTLANQIDKTSYFYLSKETLDRSNFKYLRINSSVNLEKSLVYGKDVSGHYVQGHVDTIGIIKNIKIIDETWAVKISISNKYKKFLGEKSSISINGVSLTIGKIENNSFFIYIIPHTLKLTNLIKLKKNNIVNIEFDLFNKYLFKISN